MEVVGAVASTLQIVSACGQTTMTIIRWVESVKNVDERIDSFVHEINTLRTTYENLEKSLRDPLILEAARTTNRDVGGNLWTQMSSTLKDCERTMISITRVLRRIQDSKGPFKSVIKQLKEDLLTGELFRLREQVAMYNSGLQLPMQMITLTLQLKQQEMTAAHQLRITEQLDNLREGIRRVERISTGLTAPRRQSTFGGSTIVDEPPTWKENMKTYVGTAKKFLDGASIAASTLSAASTHHRDEVSTVTSDVRRGSAFVPLTAERLRSITMYVDDLPGETGSGGTLQASDKQSTSEAQQYIVDEGDDDDTDLIVLQELLHNGHTAFDSGDFAAAEENYSEAHLLSRENSFETQIACSTADIALMLGQCLVKQEKYDQAITLLQPLANLSGPRSDAPAPDGASAFSSSTWIGDIGQALSAHHLLGEVYLKKSELDNAELHAVQAFRGRKKSQLFGPSHHKTLQSCNLVIQTYKARGQNAKAKAYEKFLVIVPEPRPPPLSPGLTDTTSPPPEPITPPTEAPQVHRRRPTFSGLFSRGRSDKSDTAPSAIAIIGTGNDLFLSTSNELRSSPRDNSGLHRRATQESTNASDAPQNVQRFVTTADLMTELAGPTTRTRNPLTRAPTLYAAMSPAEMQQKFLEISSLCKNGKNSEAVKKGINFLHKYDPDEVIFVHRQAEIEKNIKKSKLHGLANTGYGFAPLHFFCSLQFEAMLEISALLNMGADVNAVAYKAGFGDKNVDPMTPLTLAIDRGHVNVVRVLLERGADRLVMEMKGTRHPLLSACNKSHVEIVKLLLDHGMKVTEEQFSPPWRGNSLLHEACFRCNIDLVKLLLKYAPLQSQAPKYSFIGCVAQQDQFGLTPIMQAVDMRDLMTSKWEHQQLYRHKLRNRVACLRLLLGLEEKQSTSEQDPTTPEDVSVNPSQRGQDSPSRMTTNLYIEDKKGNTVYWYADESRGGEVVLRTFLDEQGRKGRLIDI